MPAFVLLSQCCPVSLCFYFVWSSAAGQWAMFLLFCFYRNTRSLERRFRAKCPLCVFHVFSFATKSGAVEHALKDLKDHRSLSLSLAAATSCGDNRWQDHSSQCRSLSSSVAY